MIRQHSLRLWLLLCTITASLIISGCGGGSSGSASGEPVTLCTNSQPHQLHNRHIHHTDKQQEAQIRHHQVAEIITCIVFYQP